MGNKSSVTESKNEETPSLSTLLESNVESIKETTPKKVVKYTSNPILNEILNETQGGIPREGEMVGLLGNGFGNLNGSEQINEVKAPDNAPKEVKSVYQAMNKDYRSLMKAVDKKRNKG